MFLDHGPVVPFAMAGLSIEGYVQDDGDDRAKTNYLGFRFGAGAHIFLADSFSLDPRVELGWSTDVGGDTEGLDVSRLQFGIVVGFSGWFGGGEAAPDYALGPAPGAGPGPSPTPTAAATTETLDFGGGVAATFYGTPGEPDMVVRFQRRGPTPVLASCQELVWQVDGQPAEMRVHADQSGEAGDVLETLEGKTAASNARFLGSARVVTLTVCGASFSLTPQHLQQLGDFAGRMQPAAQPAQNDPWGRPAY
ncbi:MAG: hypothetical protein CMN30_18385 [Sandaracinus sp.]|mgnify:CR=1 FL=1|nr:hypothetical protein [Sandaracinus sp.]